MSAAGLIAGASILGWRHQFPVFQGGAFQAQASRADTTVELEDFLFIQRPEGKAAEGAIHLLWIPQPLQSLCLGKTAKQCSTIDFCIRTTSRQVAMCQNLGVDLAKLKTYPPNVRPRRQLSVTYFQAAQIKGLDALRKYFESQPAATLERLSMSARIKAKIKLTRSPDDDDFDLLEVLAVPPL